MTAIPLAVPLLREGVLHFLGYRGRGVPRPRTEDALERVLNEARRLVHPRGLFRIEGAKCAEALGLKPRPALELALGLVTIGPALEKRVTEFLAAGEMTSALLLDAAGSAAAEEAADELERRIHTRHVPRRFSPGYGAWPLTAQRALFQMLPHREIDVRLLPSCLMMPRKSVSFAVWLGPESESDVPEECRAGRCESCDLTTCPYRNLPTDEEGGRRADRPPGPQGAEGP
jgi:hypothetical protein